MVTPENTSDEGGPLVGVLALQGAFARHIEALARSGASTREVRQPKHLDGLDALVIPGGESSTISKLLDSSGLRPMVQDLLDAGLPVFGTCAGMILLASAVLDGRSDQASFGAIDMAVRRNGYGRQINSFEADLAIPAIGESPFRAVFIRAPKVESVGDGVEVLAAVEGVPVLCKQGAVLVAAFHPELTDDHRLHQVFVAGL
ncbi:MAG: 5'-phosphate synthase pdxT subunit [Acidimicrobiales bacterium]